MNKLHLSSQKEIELNEKEAVKRLANLVRFMRGELSLNELRIKVKNPLPLKLLALCDPQVGYLPHLTQTGLGKHLGCTYAAVQAWERGDKPAFPRLHTFVKMAKFCNLTVNELTDLIFDVSGEPVQREVNFNDFEELLDTVTKSGLNIQIFLG